jgi:ABC-type branched-subunit amino acid transport system substrate-binding protein
MKRLALRSLPASPPLVSYHCAMSANLDIAQYSYVISYITDLSGPLADSYTPTWEGFELYIKALNDRGGISGKKVDVTLDDDGLKADRAVAAAKKQVERDNVIGIFGLSLSSTQGPVYAEMRKVGVPVVTWLYSVWFLLTYLSLYCFGYNLAIWKPSRWVKWQ